LGPARGAFAFHRGGHVCQLLDSSVIGSWSTVAQSFGHQVDHAPDGAVAGGHRRAVCAQRIGANGLVQKVTWRGVRVIRMSEKTKQLESKRNSSPHTT